MHILFHIPYGVIGGAETHIKYLVKFLSPGFRASISCEHKATMDFAESVTPGQAYYTPSANGLYRLMETQRVDIVQFYHSPTVYLALKKMSRRPWAVEVVHNRHHFQGDSTHYPKNHTDVVVGVSPDAADYFMISCPGVRTEVIPNGIDHTVFFDRAVPSTNVGPLVGGFTGRLETDGGKGIMQIIDVARACPGVSFELVGLDYGGHFAKFLKTSSIRNVRLLPHTDNVVEHYTRWDFFISMSPSEGFGISIAEAMACGLPCIVKNCGGICHYIKDGKHAFLVGGPEEAVEILKTKNMRKHGLAPTELDFSARAMARRYECLYDDLVFKKKSRPQAEETAGSTLVVRREPQRGMERNGKTLGISPASWHGIRRSMTTLCDQWCDPEDALATIKTMKPTVVVFGSYKPTLDPIRVAAQLIGAKTVLTWHGTHLFNEFSEGDRRLMARMIQMAREGHFDYVATPHRGTAETWRAFGIPTDYLPNLLPDPPNTVPLTRPGGPHIGIMGTGFPWKNMETQILGAAMVSNASVHVQAMHADMVLGELGARFVREKTVWGKEYINLMGSMSVNLSVGITETFGYYAAESMLYGVPAVVSPMLAFMRDCPDELRPCVVQEIDNPCAVSAAIGAVLSNRKAISRTGKEFIISMNENNKALVNTIKEKWLSK